MKKKLLTVALTATMVIGSVFSAFAAKTEVDFTGWWTTHSDSYEVDEDGVNLTFKNTTYEAATYNHNTPSVVVYTADEPKVQLNAENPVAGYKEYAVIRSDNYAWAPANVNGVTGDVNTGLAKANWDAAGYKIDSTGVPTSTAEWATWLTENKAGVDCKVKVTVKDGKATVEFTNNGLTSTTTIPKIDTTKKVYVAIAGDSCKITDIAEANKSPNGKSPQVSPGGSGPEVPDKVVVSEKEIQNIADSAEVTGDNVPKGADLVFKPIAKDDKAFAATNEFVAKNFAEAAKGGHYAFVDISLEKAGGKVQPLNNGKVKITLTITKLNAFDELKENDVVSIYRVSDDGKEITLIGESKVAAGGKLSFETDHFSKYLFVAGAAPKDTTDNNTNTDKDADGKTPTGDTAPIMLLAFAAVVACGTVVFVNKKRAK